MINKNPAQTGDFFTNQNKPNITHNISTSQYYKLFPTTNNLIQTHIFKASKVNITGVWGDSARNQCNRDEQCNSH